MRNSILYFSDYTDTNDISLTKKDIDNYDENNYDGKNRQSLTTINPGTWIKFSNLIIPQGEFSACMIFASTLQRNQTIEIRRGTNTGPLLWSTSIQAVSVENFFTDSVTGNINFEETNAVDIFFCFPEGFSGYLNWFVLCQNPEIETHEAKLQRMKWFNDARFGHMIHWGAYSVLGQGEWVMNKKQIPKDEYINEACIPFNPLQYDPEKWADIIQSTGQKYLTITTKHHDGFAMFDTNIIEFAPYDVVNTATIHSSVLRPLAEACRKRGIVFCCYYSWLDWGNVNEVSIENAAAIDPATINPDDVTRYLSEMKEHLRELIEIFDPALIWFDGSWAAFVENQNKADLSTEIKWFLHRLSPDITINERIGGSPNQGDFNTYEQAVAASTQINFWESCQTTSQDGSWGYTTASLGCKPVTELMGYLFDSASKGGNMLLNTGPTGDGVIEQSYTDALALMGGWMEKWGNAIYGTRAGTLDVSAQTGVYCTVGSDNKAYIIITQLPTDNTLRIQAAWETPVSAYWMDAPETKLTWSIENGLYTFSLQDPPSDQLGIVLVLEFTRLPQARNYPDQALFRDVSTDNIWGNDVAGYGPQFCVDGDETTRWATQYTVDPENPDSPFSAHLTVNLGTSETFTRIAFMQYDQRIGDFTVDIMVNGNWQTILSGNKPAQNFTRYLTSPATTDTVRLNITSAIDNDNPPSLYSFSLINANDPLLPVNQPINLAKGAAAASNNVWNDERGDYSAIHATDGDSATRWATNDVPELPVTLDIIFLKEESFNIIKIDEFTTQGDPEKSRVGHFTIQLQSSAGAPWQEIYNGIDIQQSLVFPTLQTGVALRISVDKLTSEIQPDYYLGPSFREVAVYQTSQAPMQKLTNDELLEAEARLSFEFLWREANLTKGSAGYGLVADTRGTRVASIACSGFALSGLVIAVERGWISKAQAEERCLLSLKTLLNEQLQYHGFFYHFINMDSLDTQGSEISTVDTMLALNGVLTAGQYFQGECSQLAQQIFDRVEWSFAVASDGNFTMGWDADFNLIPATWGGYAEQFCMYPMAAGSTTYAPTNPANMFYQLERKVGHYKNSGDLVYVWGGQLFTYQFSHAWLDFRKLIDRKGVDWWQNSVNASNANRLFCIDNHELMPSLGENDWGLTACNGPSGYRAYGAPPSGNIGANNMHVTDGTITPSGPIGSLPFMPDEVIAAMQHWYNDPQLWTPYGFNEAYNLSSARPWYYAKNSGLIKGLTLLMIENYRSNLIWETYMAHPVLKKGIPIIFDPIES